MITKYQKKKDYFPAKCKKKWFYSFYSKTCNILKFMD